MTEPLTPSLLSSDTSSFTGGLVPIKTGQWFQNGGPPMHNSKAMEPTTLTCSSQAQQHSHPEDPEENEDGKSPQWLEEQEWRVADGFIYDLEKFNCQCYSLSEDKNQAEQNCLVKKGLE